MCIIWTVKLIKSYKYYVLKLATTLNNQLHLKYASVNFTNHIHSKMVKRRCTDSFEVVTLMTSFYLAFNVDLVSRYMLLNSSTLSNNITKYNTCSHLLLSFLVCIDFSLPSKIKISVFTAVLKLKMIYQITHVNKKCISEPKQTAQSLELYEDKILRNIFYYSPNKTNFHEKVLYRNNFHKVQRE